MTRARHDPAYLASRMHSTTQEPNMKQCTTLAAVNSFDFINPETNRRIRVRAGQRFWVTNCGTDQTKHGSIAIDREGRGCISHGYRFKPEQLAALFSIVE